MGCYKYTKISLAIIPDKIIVQYNLLQLALNGLVYLEIRKGMPGLKQAGRIANDRLKIHLAKFGYSPVTQTPSKGKGFQRRGSSQTWKGVS